MAGVATMADLRLLDPALAGAASAAVTLGDGREAKPRLVGGVLTAHASAFGSKGTRIFSPCGAAVVCHSVKTMKQLGTLTPHPGRVTALVAGVFRKECPEPLVTGCEAGEVRLCDSKSCTCLSRLDFGAPIQAIRWPSVNVLLVVTGRTAVSVDRVNITSLAAPKRDGVLPLDAESAGAFDAAGDSAALCHEKLITVWSKGWSSRRQYKAQSRITVALVDPKERFLATGDEKGVVLMWWGIFEETTKRPTQQRWHWHTKPVGALANCGPLMLSGGEEGVLCIRNIEDETLQFIPRFPAPLRHIGSDVTGTHIYISLEENSVALIEGLHGIVKPKYIRALDVPILVSRGNQASKRWGAALHVLPDGAVAATGGGRRVQFLDGFGKVIPGRSLEIDRGNAISEGDPSLQRWVLGKVAFSAKGESLLTCEGRRNPALERFEEAMAVRSLVLKWWRRNESGQYVVDSIANEPHTAEITVAIPHPHKENVYVTGSLDGSFKTWDRPASAHEEIRTGWRCVGQGSWRNRPILSGCFAADGSAVALGFHGFAVVWEHDTLTELGVLPAGEETDRVVQLHSAVACGRFLLMANIHGKGRREVICWDLAQLAVLARLDFTSSFTGERRCVTRVAEAFPGAAASSGIRLLAFQAPGGELQVWRLASKAPGGEPEFQPEASATLPSGRRLVDATFAGLGGQAVADGTGCPVLCWTTDYDLWHLDLSPPTVAARGEAAEEDPALPAKGEMEEERPAKAQAVARLLAGDVQQAVLGPTGLEDLQFLDFKHRETYAQKVGIVPALVEKITPSRVPSHALPPPSLLWESFVSVFGKPSPAVERERAAAAMLPSTPEKTARRAGWRVSHAQLPPWLQKQELQDPGAAAELVSASWMDALVAEALPKAA